MQIMLWGTTKTVEDIKEGKETFVHARKIELYGSKNPLVKLIFPLEAVEHLGNGEYRVLIKGVEY